MQSTSTSTSGTSSLKSLRSDRHSTPQMLELKARAFTPRGSHLKRLKTDVRGTKVTQVLVGQLSLHSLLPSSTPSTRAHF